MWSDLEKIAAEHAVLSWKKNKTTCQEERKLLMKSLAQSEIVALVADINSFAERSEILISTTQKKYEEEKKALKVRHSSELSSIDSAYTANCSSVQNKSKQTIADAKKIYAEIAGLDTKLSKIDKYYVKTKQKKEASLVNTTSDAYNNVTDYFRLLSQIKDSYQALYKKYSDDILPSLLNGLNYLFSSKRKKDYEELIVLRNTVLRFVKEIEQVLSPLTEENLAALKEEYQSRRGSLVDRQNREKAAFESNYSVALDKVADQIYTELENLLPDEFVDYLYAIMDNYQRSVHKVNAAGMIQDEVLDMCFVDYPVDFFVQSTIVASIIKEKCSKILVEGSIRLPVMISTANAPVWMIQNDNSNTTVVQAFTHSVMYGMLSSCPVEKILYTIVDPENRGNSISPFFDAKKKLPELFGEKIYISKDEVALKIRKLNDKIENILQDKLGNQYDNIFDYSMNKPEYKLNVELMVLYDFPRGFDEHTLAELRNVLRNGSRCGIYTLISYLPYSDDTFSREYHQNLKSIIELSTLIKQENDSFLFYGLPLLYYKMPEKVEFAKFFSKYMLIFEGIKNRGIAFSPLLRKLIEAKDSIELDAHIEQICEIMKTYEKTYALVPEINSVFPTIVTLGSVYYPADVFSDSCGFEHIVKIFGVRDAVEAENTSFVELPLTFNLRNSFNLFLNCPEENSIGIRGFTHHVIWSFLSFMPVTKVNVCVFDSEQRGNSIIPFLEFRKRSPETFGNVIYTSQEQITERLKQINSQIDEFIQEKLGNRYKDILDYNLNTPNRAEPITLLMLYDFPGGMDGRSIDLLTNILRNGNKCGVFTIICHNPDIIFSRYESIDERLEQIGRYCASIDYKDGNYSLLPYNLKINIPEPLSYNVTETFIDDYIKKCDIIRNQGLSFQDIIAKELFSAESSKFLRIPIGVGDGDSIINLTIGEGSSHHGLVAGATGSGKSTLLHTIIMSSMLHYGPDQLHLYLMDFKSGTEFKIYESVKLPHIQLLALDAMQEFGESILEKLVEEMEARARAFKNDAGGVSKIKDYVSVTGKPMPRILVIMDEFQILFNDATNRKVANHCAELTKRLVTEGRSFGIHLLMSTQSTRIISDLTLSSGTVEQMRIRIGLKCGENDARYLFTDKNDLKALTMMKGPIGTAVMNMDYTEQSNIGFRAAYCDDETQRYYLDLISKTYADYPSSLQTFEGSRTRNLADYFADAHIGMNSELPIQIHMGTLIKVAPPFAIQIDKKQKHNLLVCGSNEKMANTISNNYMISALLNRNALVYCIDGDKLVGDDGSSDVYEALHRCSAAFKSAEDRADIIRFINEIYIKYQSWKKQNSDDVIFVVIKNLQFLDIVKSMFKGEMIDESEFIDEGHAEPEFNAADPFAAVNSMFANRGSDDMLSIGDKLIKMIKDGSGFGIHFVVTSLEYQTIRECMYYGENILAKFPERVIFSLNASDAGNLIENVSLAGLRENTVYFTDSVKNTFQLKPYITPDAEDIRKLF